MCTKIRCCYSWNLGDDVSVLAPPGGEPKKEGSLISVKEAADSLDNTLVVSDNFMR